MNSALPEGLERLPAKERERQERGVPEERRLEAVLRNPATYTFGADFDLPDPSLGGRPAQYPLWLWRIYGCVADIYGSARNADTHLADPITGRWEQIRTAAAEMTGTVLPATPPSRSWYVKTRDRKILPNLHLLRLQQIDEAVTAAREVGLADPDKPFDVKDRERRVVADGHVITPITDTAKGTTKRTKARNIETGEIVEYDRPVRYDPDVKMHTTGDKRRVVGNMVWHGYVRGPQPFRRVVLAVDSVPGVKGQQNSENHVMMRNFELLATDKRLGIVGATIDGVARGVDLDRMQSEWGWIPASPVAARSINDKTGERTEKEGPFDSYTLPGCTGGPVKVHYHGGRLVKAEILEDGRTAFTPLKHKQVRRRPNKNGTWRVYVEYELPCNCGNHSRAVLEPTITTDKDREKNFNRGENIRAIPPGTDLYEDCYTNRSAIEGDNRRIDDHLQSGRARSYGRDRQLLDLLAHQHHLNSLALHLHGPQAPTGPGRPIEPADAPAPPVAA